MFFYFHLYIYSFVALNYIGAGEFSIVAQLKILSTASFSVLILNTSLSWTKWRALILLVLGCVLVASPNFAAGTVNEIDMYTRLLFGYGSVLTEVALSGFASIYFEKVIKGTNITIWERNFQLGLYSILMYGCIILYESMYIPSINILFIIYLFYY
jgi:UDP-sugar transporter A1/2/3